MSRTHPRFTTYIRGRPEVIFELVADMPNYGRWLPGSEAFGGTTKVEPYPVRLGTTYLDAGPAGERPGSVTAYEYPTRIAFHHTMLIRKGPLLADIDVDINYTFETRGDGTFVDRQLDLSIVIPGPLKLATPFVRYAFKKENLRVLAKLKTYVESLSRI